MTKKLARFTPGSAIAQHALAILLFALLLPPSAYGQHLSKAEDEATALDRNWAHGVLHNDATTLKRLFADDVMVIASNGTIRNKQQEIADITPPPGVTTDAFDIENVKPRALGDAVVSTGKATLKVTSRGSPGSTQFLYTHVYRHRNHAWQIVLQHFTRIMNR